ncbi:regulatory protein LacI [Thioalkalivibrio nitratireducens DSM 14787]|uniref:Regulatory protein LacI n=1 Tax=Thioalkalivibrio nitratireducens (strain DSM 14787 / UNIQEM 213 / ALEN2) TaxID=1255043 RepID=L0DVK8_THIND|nr:helix-turn-helix domain-containing protein [Thioalkalivibrio nitratireducens]AGA33068.1 regulatory protein LacI [Thioalkalivibrio nitratireducens DSM 14787]
MARPLRIEVEGGVYHVSTRGNARDPVYLDAEDRQVWLDLLGEVCSRFQWRCFAWCQLQDHYRLVMETRDPNLSRGMRHLNGVYTQRLNRRHERTGHVFRGRYEAILLEKNRFLPEAVRDVILAPVRIGFVERAFDWRWSSLAAMLEPQTAPPWLDTGWLAEHFGDGPQAARDAFVAFVEQGLAVADLTGARRAPAVLGSPAFLAAVRNGFSSTPDFREVPRIHRKALTPSWEEYERIPDRRRAMAEAYLSGGYTMREIAERFGVHYSTVSRAIRNHRAASNEGGVSGAAERSPGDAGSHEE